MTSRRPRWPQADIDRLIWMRDHDGMRLKAIAAELGRSYDTVRAKWYRLTVEKQDAEAIRMVREEE